MAQRASVPHPSHQPLIRRGADDQAAAFDAWLAQLPNTDPADDERAWQQVRRGLQETRKALGQRLLFPE